MAAGAVVEIFKGSNVQITQAAALVIKNIMGLVCDPIAGLVEVPCIKRNPFLAFYSLAAAELAMADIQSVIPPDEVIDAMYQVGLLMSPQLKKHHKPALLPQKQVLKLHKVWKEFGKAKLPASAASAAASAAGKSASAAT
jgi:L-serine dehydratase